MNSGVEEMSSVASLLLLLTFATDFPEGGAPPPKNVKEVVERLMTETNYKALVAVVHDWKKELASHEGPALVGSLLERLGSSRTLALATSNEKRHDLRTERGRAAWALERYLGCELPVIDGVEDAKSVSRLVIQSHEAVIRAMSLPVRISKGADEPKAADPKAADGKPKEDKDEFRKLPWKLGTVWCLEIWDPAKGWDGNFVHVAFVRKDEMVRGDLCWKIVFAPPGKAASHWAWYGNKDGLLRKITHVSTMVELECDPVTGIPWLVDPFDRIPGEVFLPGTAMHVIGPNWEVFEERKGNEIVLGSTYSDAKGEKYTVRQTWRDGQEWWSSSERFHNGIVQTKARLCLSETKPVKTASNVKSVSDTELALRADQRLQALVSISMEAATVREVMDELQGTCGLRFYTDPAPEVDAQRVGLIRAKNVPVWHVMQHLGAATGGKWDVRGEDYYLVVVNAHRTNGRVGWLLMVVALVGAAIVMTGIIRKRIRGSSPNTDTSSSKQS